MRRKKHNYKKFLSVLVLFAFLALLSLGFYQLKVFKVNHINCQEEGFPCSTERLEIFKEAYEKNIFLLKTAVLAEKIKNDPVILEANFKKKLPSTLKIEIKRRKPVASLTSDEKDFFLVDDQGMVFQGPFSSQQRDSQLALIILPTELFVLETGLNLNHYLAFGQALKLQSILRDFFISFEKIKVESEGDLTLVLNGNMEAKLSSVKELKPQVASLQLILKQSKIEDKLIYKIDLRFDKPVIKFYP